MKACAGRIVPVLFLLAALGPVPTAPAQEISIAKDTIRASVNGRECHMGECGPGSFLLFPAIEYELNGALPSGSQPWVEFTVAGKPTLRMDCGLDEVWGRENRWKVTCGNNTPEAAFIFAGKVDPGTVSFRVGLRNELMETESVTYTGAFRFEKKLRSPGNEATAECFDNDDWRNYVPMRMANGAVQRTNERPDVAGKLICSAHDPYVLRPGLPPVSVHLYQLMDHKRTLAEIAQASRLPEDIRDERTRDLFETLWKYDQVMFHVKKA